MKIYAQEISDGLQDMLLSNNTIAYCALAEKYTPSKEEKNSADEMCLTQALLDKGNEDQIDLYYLKSILVSTGWNKNDDVFDPKELWEARNTPEDKPFNFMHDEKDIIGHITGNVAVDFDGNEIDESAEEAPSQFNILTTSVIYTSWSDVEQKQRMQKIVSEIEEGKWFVSMECLFPEFDYALTAEDGKTSVVPRNEASAFLTKHLRSYGGTGKYQNYQVGRLLRNLSFSGKGLVSKPANPRSIILEGNEFFDESKACALDINSIKEKKMSDNVVNEQIIDLQKELAETKAANEALKSELATSQTADFEETIKTLQASLDEKTAEVTELTEAGKKDAEAIQKKEDAIMKKDEEVKALKEELAIMKKKDAMMKRKADLEEAGLDAEEASATVSDFEEADDETFAKVVALMKKKAKHTPEHKEEEKKEKEAEATVEDEVDSSEASEEDLDTVEETAEVAIAEAAEEDEDGSLRAVASEWLGSVLRSTPQE